MEWRQYWTDCRSGVQNGVVLLAVGNHRQGVRPEESLVTQAAVTARLGEGHSFASGALTLTTHRLVWVEGVGSERGGQAEVMMGNRTGGAGAWALALPLVRRAEAAAYLRGGFLGLSSPKLTLYLHTQPGADPPQIDYMELSFKGGGRDDFLAALTTALRQQAWLVDASLAAKGGFSTHRAGLGGVLRGREEQGHMVTRTLETAFADLDSLMAQAADLVRLTERWTATEAGGQGDGPALVAMLHNMGIPNPVTRRSAGSAYHEQLAVQLAAFLPGPLEKAGGTLTLTAAYCIVNRARGTELISPEDLTHACRLLGSVGSPITLAAFPSGFTVLQSASRSGAVLRAGVLRAAEQAASTGGVAAVDVAHALEVSLALAKEHLLAAEQAELLCRDETLEDLRFYINFF
jgi:ESCRT-II complex subunit VPS36